MMTTLERIKDYSVEGRREENLKRPTVYYLENFGKYLFAHLKELDKTDISTETSSKIISLKHSLDIFIADLTGELKHDYDNDLKRYRPKWLTQKGNLDSLKAKFLEIYNEIEEQKKDNH